jgi:hypothetical protein
MTMQWGGLAQKVLGSQAGQQVLGNLLGAVAGGTRGRSALTGDADRGAGMGTQQGTRFGGSRRGRTGTKTGMVAMPARLPNKRQWKKVQGRLHDWRAISIQVINRTGGMTTRRRGGFRRAPQGRGPSRRRR